MKHLWIYVVFLMVLYFQRIPASDVCFSNEQTYDCSCTSPPVEVPPFFVNCTVPPLSDNVSSSCSPGDSVCYNRRCNFSCPTGYNLTGPSSVTCTGSNKFSELFPECVDIDECTLKMDNCDVNALCTNTDGSFTCQCKEGFAGNGTSCNDIDECTLKMDNCDVNARCTNTDGSFTCQCKEGFAGNGNSCNVDCNSSVNPCMNGGTCENKACTCASGFTGPLCAEGLTTLALALPIAFLLLVAIGLLAFVYHRYRVIHGRKGRINTPEPLVQEGTLGAGLQQSSSAGHLPSGGINPPLAFNDGLEMDSRLNSDEVDRHDAEVKGLSYRQTVDEHRASSGNRAKESDLNEVPQKELRV